MTKRTSGILLPVYALSSNYGCGTMGKEMYNFIQWLALSKQKAWEVLPIGPTNERHNPYRTYSMFAGNPLFIDLDELALEGLLTQEEIDACEFGSSPEYIDYEKLFKSKDLLLRSAYAKGKSEIEFSVFKRSNAYWLRDYAFYMALKNYFNGAEWMDWPDEGLRKREILTMEKYGSAFEPEIDYHSFVQYKFYQQWEKALKFAHENGVEIIGEINALPPIDSSDVWAHQQLFDLNSDSKPSNLYAIPIRDTRNTTSVYDSVPFKWDVMREDKYNWWMKRIEFNLKTFDYLKIKNFSTVDNYFTIPYDRLDSNYGSWNKGPGMEFVDVVLSWFGKEKFVALGGESSSLSDKLIEEAGLCKQRCIQKAFKRGTGNPNLPHNLDKNVVYYLGRVSDLPLEGFAYAAPKLEVDVARMYCLGILRDDLPFAMIRTALASPANMVIIPMQDVLGLDEKAATVKLDPEESFRWRFNPAYLTAGATKKLGDYTELYGRY